MFNWLSAAFIALYLFSFNAFAFGGDNPFAKNESLSTANSAVWNIDKEAVEATKSIEDDGTYYHLQFDNKQIKLVITSDAAGVQPRTFSQFEIQNVEIDGEQAPLFKWCLSNQERHSRFLQQGLTVKKGVCTIDANAGTFIMRLNSATLKSLQSGSRLLISLQPFRTTLELKYDISDFSDMYTALNAKPEPVFAKAPVVANVPAVALSQSVKICKAEAPAKYKKIKAVEYKCVDIVAKTRAEASVDKLVAQEKEKQQKQKLAAEKDKLEKDKLRQLAEAKKKKEMAARDEQERRIQLEAAAVIEKQAALGQEISAKMISMCNKFWTKGEHRCYCEKYIEHAPSGIVSDASCK